MTKPVRKVQIWRWAPRFLKETDGVMTYLTLFFFVMMVGIGGLGIDIGRLYGLRGQMMTHVDQAALAAAAELDGKSVSGGDTALDRALRAVIGDDDGGPLISTSYNFANDDLTVYNLIFLSSITSGAGPTPQAADVVVCTYQDGAWLSGCDTAANAAKAKYVAVTTAPTSVSYFVLPIADFFLGSSAMATTGTLQMQATAGYNLVACNLTPMMMCNPHEPSTNTDTSFFDLDSYKGHELNLQTTSAGVNGYYGWIDPDPGQAGPCSSDPHPLDCMLARSNPNTQCINAGAIDPSAGAQAHTFDSLNTRFDMYQGTQGSNKDDPLYAPAANTTKGICDLKNATKANASCTISGNPTCSPSGVTNLTDMVSSSKVTVPLPRDSSFDTGGLGAGMASGALATYWSTNHTGVAYPTGTSPADGSAYTTRYSIYRYEITHPVDKSGVNGEKGIPMCNTATQTDTSETPPARDRRVLYVAVVDCTAAGMTKANPCTGGGFNPCMPVAGYLKLFMTEPVGFDSNQTNFSSATQNANVYGEIVDAVKAGEANNIVHRMPILYR